LTLRHIETSSDLPQDVCRQGYLATDYCLNRSRPTEQRRADCFGCFGNVLAQLSGVELAISRYKAQ